MSWKDVFSRLVPNIWDGFRERSRVKSKHINNIYKLQNGEYLQVEFDDSDTYALGYWAETKHNETVEKIRSDGNVQVDRSYAITNPDDRKKIFELTRQTIRRIQLRNILSFIFWLVYTISLVVIVAFATSYVGSII